MAGDRDKPQVNQYNKQPIAQSPIEEEYKRYSASDVAPQAQQLPSVQSQYSAGVQEGQNLFKEYFGDSAQYKEGLAETLSGAKERANKGMNSAQMAPITGQYQQDQRALRAALGSSGMGKGGMAANVKLSQDRAYNIALANKNVEVMSQNRANLDKIYAQRATSGVSIPMLMGSQYASAAASQIALQNQAQAGQMQSDSGGISVICTELHKHGYFTEEVYKADETFGIIIRKYMPEVYTGYLTWAQPIVKLMQKSEIFTKIVALFGVPWANHMAYTLGFHKKNSLFGSLLMKVGLPVCALIGKCKKEVIYG